MNSQRLTSEPVRDSAKFVATELLREPIKATVRDALHEEAAIVQGGEEAAHVETERAEATHEEAADREEREGRSVWFWSGLVASMVGIAYLARKRMASTGPATSAGPQGAGYETEGQLETAETGGDETTSPEGPGPSSPTGQ